MTQDDIRRLLNELEGVRLLVASADGGAPESAWGDAFFYYDPDTTGDQTMPFATIVTRNTPGWDEMSDLDRPGAFRVNLAVGREHVPSVQGAVDHRQGDVVLPHPHYAAQGWVAVVNPASRGQLEALVRLAYDRAVRRHRPGNVGDAT